jgi:hypothetical protein
MQIKYKHRWFHLALEGDCKLHLIGKLGGGLHIAQNQETSIPSVTTYTPFKPYHHGLNGV